MLKGNNWMRISIMDSPFTAELHNAHGCLMPICLPMLVVSVIHRNPTGSQVDQRCFSDPANSTTVQELLDTKWWYIHEDVEMLVRRVKGPPEAAEGAERSQLEPMVSRIL